MTEVMKTPPPSSFSPHLKASEPDRSNHRRSNRSQPRTYSRQPSTDHEDSEEELREPSEWDYPEQAMKDHMKILDEKRSANLERINKTFALQKENLKKMSDGFEYQAWEDFAGLEDYEIEDDIRRARGQYMLRDWAESSSDDDDL
ncbi:hypothetical protein Unana1_03060 [Umbelopsis nana]